MAKWTPVDGGALFEGPGMTNSVSGGTAAFYKVALREPHPSTGSKGYYIAKDLAHAVDEVEIVYPKHQTPNPKPSPSP
jgi:hypothetical protein